MELTTSQHPAALEHRKAYLSHLQARRVPEAIASCRKAIENVPDSADTHWDLASLLLLNGEFAEGWRELEHRWRSPRLRGTSPLPPGPMWDGSDPVGKTILLVSEQGVGDTLQLARYATPLAQKGARVIMIADRSIRSLLESIEGVSQVVAYTEPIKSYHTWLSMLSLPGRFDTMLETIPQRVPYLRADANRVAQWRERLSSDPSKLKVGLCWAGNPRQAEDRWRSTQIDALAPLASVGDMSFYSLQKGVAAEQAKRAPQGMKLFDWTDDLHDFADTAALIENLGLVISVCTSVAHLAGALGKPTWTMLFFNSDWRWLLDREDSPWYPTMRLFRQPARNDWNSVTQRVASELRALATARSIGESSAR